MAGKKFTVALIYFSYKDPLFQNLVFEYIKTLCSKGYTFGLITFEHERFALSASEQQIEKKRLSALGIDWTPLNYHNGRFQIFWKALDVLLAFQATYRYYRRDKAKLIFGFTNISGVLTYLFASILRIKSLVYCYEPHSDYLTDFGIWRKSSLKYRLFNFLEWRAGMKLDYVLASTKHVIADLEKHHPKGELVRAPVSINEHDFYFRPDGYDRVRTKHDLHGKNVLIYLGKFGYLYFNDEIIDLYYYLSQNIENLHFLVVTSNDFDEIRGYFEERNIPSDQYTITGLLSFDEVKDYLSAADIGISGVPYSPSQKYRSPTKVGEYLMTGLPYITCRGVAEDDEYAEEFEVGVVLEDFNKEEVLQHSHKVRSLLAENESSRRERCRKIGIQYRGKSNIDFILDEIYGKVFPVDQKSH